MKDITIKPGIYEHYKGKHYEVIGIARHSETVELLVLYKALYKTEFGEESLWVRPYEMFVENVQHHGKKVKRFKYIGGSQ